MAKIAIIYGSTTGNTEAGATVVGSCSADSYSFTESRACVDGVFVGLPVDDDASDNDDRIAAWVESISPEFK